MQKIMVPIDGSAGCENALRFAADLATRFDAELELVYAYDTPGINFGGVVAFSKEDSLRAKAAATKTAFERAEAVLKEHKVLRRHVSLEGVPSVELINYAKKSRPFMVVMGSRGVATLDGIILGSVSERVMRGADCPVTIIKS
ncbi:MAG: universal stress protein [Myxococcales bacterium]|nr:MAG: universal stress protein [Myxococcales bacterium]